MALSQWRTRVARLGYRQAVDPLPVFLLKIVTAARGHPVRGRAAATGSGNLPWVLVLLTLLVLAYSLVTSRAVFGRQIYAIGGNLQAAVLSGIKVKQVVFRLFVNMGVLAALAGVIFAGRLNQAGPTPRATPSSSTPSRRPSSAARRCRAASARSWGRSPAASSWV